MSHPQPSGQVESKTPRTGSEQHTRDLVYCLRGELPERVQKVMPAFQDDVDTLIDMVTARDTSYQLELSTALNRIKELESEALTNECAIRAALNQSHMSWPALNAAKHAGQRIKELEDIVRSDTFPLAARIKELEAENAQLKQHEKKDL